MFQCIYVWNKFNYFHNHSPHEYLFPGGNNFFFLHFTADHYRRHFLMMSRNVPGASLVVSFMNSSQTLIYSLSAYLSDCLPIYDVHCYSYILFTCLFLFSLSSSTTSSACEEASGVLSSGKSGISLDSSGLDNDNNESGIGTATPPKDLPYWKNSHNHHHHNNNDNESVSSLDALRKIKFQKSGSVASSDDPDLLEVLSLCDEPQGDEDVCTDGDGIENDHHSQQQKQLKLQQQQQQQHDNDHNNDALGEEDDADVDDDEVDEGHDEFESVTYCDCDYTDGDASSSSAGNNSRDVSGNGSSSLGGPTTIAIIPSESNGVVLRRKFSAAPPIMVPFAPGGRTQKCRSHSLDTSSLPSSYQLHCHQLHPLHQHQHYQHQHHPSHLTRKLHHHLHPAAVRSKERVQLSLALRQEPFQSLLSPTHFHELPSPSSASLHSGHESLGIQELTTKSNSAPLLLKQEKKRDDFAAQNLVSWK